MPPTMINMIAAMEEKEAQENLVYFMPRGILMPDGEVLPATEENLVAIGFRMPSWREIKERGFPYQLTPFTRYLVAAGHPAAAS